MFSLALQSGVLMKSIPFLRLRSSIAGHRAHIHMHVPLLRVFFALVCIFVHNCTRVHARQRYVGHADAALHWRGNLLFHWAITIDDEIHKCDVSVRADYALKRGVPFPTPWHNAVRCGDLSSRAAEAGRALEAVEEASI